MRVRKEWLALILSVALVISASNLVAAPSEIGWVPKVVRLNGQELFLPVPLVESDGQTLIPLRGLIESLGGEADWQAPETVTIRLGDQSVIIRINSRSATVGGRRVSLAQPARLIVGRTYVPTSLLEETLGVRSARVGDSLHLTLPSVRFERLSGSPQPLRGQASANSPAITTVLPGTVLPVTATTSGWKQVQAAPGVRGWLPDSSLQPAIPAPDISAYLPLLEAASGFLEINGDCLGPAPVSQGALLVPLRRIVEQAGGTVTWSKGTATARWNGRTVAFTEGRDVATVNGQTVRAGALPMVIDGTMAVPVRTLAEAFGWQVSWDRERLRASLRTGGAEPKGAAPCNPHLPLGSYIVLDMATGMVLAEQQANQKHPIASTTKIVTALLAVERGELDSVVSVSARAAATPGSTASLWTGEELRLHDLLYGLMLPSGNDAAAAIGEHLAGSERVFTAQMNLRAWELGARNTRFDNASGLDDDVDPYSTARDLSRIARHAMHLPVFRSIAGVNRYVDPDQNHLWTNHNDFISTYSGANGVKNGWTEKAGFTLIASAIRGDRELLIVLLDAPSREGMFQQARSLMDMAFRWQDRSWILQSAPLGR